jgi:hypothetical protein
LDVKKNGAPAVLTDDQKQAAVDDLNALARDDTGKTLLKDLPDEEKQQHDTPAKDSAYNNATSVGKKAVQKLLKYPTDAPTDNVKKAVAVATGKQDRSRVSKEYHEWKYCCIDSNNASILQDGAGMTNALLYTGSGALSTADGVTPPGAGIMPPYHKWIEYEDFREIMKIVRRYRRMRGRCGGKALWQEQGFATKIAAIQDDVDGDADYLSHRSALLAFTADWSDTEG